MKALTPASDRSMSSLDMPENSLVASASSFCLLRSLLLQFEFGALSESVRAMTEWTCGG